MQFQPSSVVRSFLRGAWNLTGFQAVRGSHGQPTVLLPWPYDDGGTFDVGYDIHPDGDRFLVVQGGAGDGFGAVYIVTNWFTELLERMGSN